MLKEQLHKDIKHCILTYGIVTILAVLTEQEASENYELCQDILDCIQVLYPDDHDIPTRYDENTIGWASACFFGGREYTFPNLNEYVNHVYRKLQIKRTYEIKLV